MKQGRKITGGKYHMRRKKRLHEKTNQESTLSIGETKRKIIRIMGGNSKPILLKTKIVNIVTEKEKAKKTEIKKVLETPQNNFLARQNRLMKGSVIDTELGKAKITNRPTQEGHVNAILVKE